MAANHNAKRSLWFSVRSSRNNARFILEDRVRMLAREATTPSFTRSVTSGDSDASAISMAPPGQSSIIVGLDEQKNLSHADLLRIPVAKGRRGRFPDPVRTVPDLRI